MLNWMRYSTLMLLRSQAKKVNLLKSVKKWSARIGAKLWRQPTLIKLKKNSIGNNTNQARGNLQ